MVELPVWLWEGREILWDLARRRWQKHYQVWPIRKASGGKRWIHAPQGRLKELQQQLARWLAERQLEPAARAYLPGGGSHLQAAQELKDNKGQAGWLYTADISDFFGHVTAWHLVQQGLPWEVIRLITIPHPHRGLVLPQGAPTSPAASNLAMRDFDRELAGSLPAGCLYLRWADDIGISSPNKLYRGEMNRLVGGLLKRYGFKMNPAKSRVAGPGGHQFFLGVKLDGEVLSLPRRYRRKKLRSKVHHWRRGETSADSLQGMLNYIRQVSPEQAAAGEQCYGL